MYCPEAFREDRTEVLHALMRTHGFATLVSVADGAPMVTHLPLHLDAGEGESAVLRGHMARANPHWQALAAAGEALAIFQGPHAYVTPSFYASKQETGKVVPTWNYAVAHCRGPVSVHQDADWLRTHVAELTDAHEAGRPEPWGVDDAPERYVQTMLRGIVGVEMEIRALDGKWKMSQNREAADFAGVAAALGASPVASDRATAEVMRALP